MQSKMSELTRDVSVFEDAAHTAWPVTPSKLERIKQEMNIDYDLQALDVMSKTTWAQLKNIFASPAQLMLGHQIKATVPTVDKVLSPKRKQGPVQLKVELAADRASPACGTGAPVGAEERR
ncbi:unnamed protein product [Merluccius merluccius]